MFSMFLYAEVFATYSSKKKAEICNLLECKNIKYKIKTVHRNDGFIRGRVGTAFENSQTTNQYRILVPRRQLDEATNILICAYKR